MRANVFLVVVFAFALPPVLLLLPSCTALVPATVTYGPSIAITGEPVIALTAARQLARIEQSLRDAGLNPTSDWGSTSYGLVVKLGNTRSTRACGTKNNVVYILSKGGQRALVIKGRGMTGSCSPNVFDDMSQQMATYFRHAG
jgi:hypothetical protein